MVVKTLKRLLAVLAILFVPALALAQVEPASLPVLLPTTDLTTDQALGELLKSLGGFKGATALGIVFLVVQALLLFFRTKLADFAGKWKLVIVTALSLVGGVIGLLVSGVPLLAALTHATTFTSLQVFGNQFIKQFAEKPATAPGAEH